MIDALTTKANAFQPNCQPRHSSAKARAATCPVSPLSCNGSCSSSRIGLSSGRDQTLLFSMQESTSLNPLIGQGKNKSNKQIFTITVVSSLSAAWAHTSWATNYLQNVSNLQTLLAIAPKATSNLSCRRTVAPLIPKAPRRARKVLTADELQGLAVGICTTSKSPILARQTSKCCGDTETLEKNKIEHEEAESMLLCCLKKQVEASTT